VHYGQLQQAGPKEQVIRINSFFLINWHHNIIFTMDLLTIFVIGLIRTSRQSFTSHAVIESTAQKVLNDSNCLISVSVKCLNVSIMDMQDSSTNGLPCNKGGD